jgi:hypothetical protein
MAKKTPLWGANNEIPQLKTFFLGAKGKGENIFFEKTIKRHILKI